MSRHKKEPQRGGQHGPGHGPMGSMVMGEKAKNFKGTLKRLLSYLKPRQQDFACCVLCCHPEYRLFYCRSKTNGERDYSSI